VTGDRSCQIEESALGKPSLALLFIMLTSAAAHRRSVASIRLRSAQTLCSMQTGGCLPEKNVDDRVDAPPPIQLLHESDEESVDVPFSSKYQTRSRSRLTLRRGTSLANWMFDAITNLTSTSTKHHPANVGVNRMSRLIPLEAFKAEMKEDRDGCVLRWQFRGTEKNGIECLASSLVLSRRLPVEG
jgi:hypothetical protein